MTTKEFFQKARRGRQGDADHQRLGRFDAVTACELQGLPPTFFDGSPFTSKAIRQMIGNGVPLPMGRAVARAVKRALDIEAVA